MIIAMLTIALLSAAALLAIFIFYNSDPVRVIPPEKNIISPADGRIVDIIDMFELKRKKPRIEASKSAKSKIKEICSDISDHCYMIIISIGMLDAHTQRAPVEGKVISVKKVKGKSCIAKNTESILKNEMNEILIKSKEIGKLKVIQVAGMFRKKLRCFVKNDEMLLKGQRIGKILFGCHAILVIPDYPLKVKKGDKVKAGETIIADYR